MSSSNLNNILIIRLSSLGDILLTTPLIRSLKKQNPEAKIDFLVKKQYSDVFSNNPYVNRVHLYDTTTELTDTLRSAMYDAVIDLQNNKRSKRLAGALNVPVYKFNKRSIDKFLLVNFKINRLKNTEQIPARYAKAIPGLELDEVGNELYLTGKPDTAIIEDKKYIGIAPGSRHFTKMWPKEFYIELSRILISEGYNIILLGGKSDRDICKEIASESGNAIDLSNVDDLEKTAGSMRKCSLIVCNDSGLMHTATAVNIPVCVFFGSTVKEFGFTPYKTKNLILENNLLNCRPCSHIGRKSCPLGHFRCMLEITPQMAFERIITLLNS